MLREFWARFRATIGADTRDERLDDELTAHRDMLIDDLRASGLSDSDARREAARRLGHTDTIREAHREQRSLPTLDLLVQSARHSVRRLVRTPVFTVVVVLTLALGIGANTALFSLIDNLLLRPLPVREPEQLFQLRVFADGNRMKPWDNRFKPATHEALRSQNRIVEDVVGYSPTDDRVTITIEGAVEPERAVDWMSPNFFRGLGVQMVVGRSADTADANVAVISSRWWRSRFGGQADALGRAIAVDGKTYTVIGVAPPRFHGFDIDRSPDLWISPAPRDLETVVRLQPGVGAAQAQAALHQILIQEFVPGDDPPNRLETDARAVGHGLSELREQYRGALWALMALVTLVLFTTCANVGNLVMLRNTARRRELAVRSALGAGRSRLLAHSFSETSLLAAAGCVGGLLFAGWGVSIIVAMLPLPGPPGSLEFQADGRVLVFASVICLVSSLLFGLGPAWRAADVDVAGTLQTGFGNTAPKRARYFGRVLVTAQVALSVLLLVGAGLFVQTLRNLSKLNVGYSTERLVEVQLDSRFAGYADKDLPPLDQLLLDRIGSITGVRSVTRTSQRLMLGSHMSMGLPIEGLDRSRMAGTVWDGIGVGPRFFETMGIEVVRGRTFTDDEFAQTRMDFRDEDPRERPSYAVMLERIRASGPYIVNEAFAKHFPPNVDPLGPSTMIVGIVKDAKLFGVKDDVQPLMFIPSRRPDRLTAMQVRMSGDPRVEVAVRQAVQDINPRLLVGMITLGEASGRSIARERMVASISGFFSVLGLALAAMGIFGIASNSVAQRIRELGIRRALGAARWVLVRDSLRETLAVMGLGLAVGAFGALVAVRVTSSLTTELLFGLAPTDVVNLLAAVAVMVFVGLAACVLPAVRATRVDPLLCIRED